MECKGSFSYWIPHKGSLMREECGIFPNMLHHYGLQSGFPYYGLTTLACSMPGLPHSTTLGHITQLLCGQSTLALGQGSEHYLVAFYDKLSNASCLFFWQPDPHGVAELKSAKKDKPVEGQTDELTQVLQYTGPQIMRATIIAICHGSLISFSEISHRSVKSNHWLVKFFKNWFV